MTLLTEAMSNPVSPYIPARPEWLDGWCGPVVASVDGVDWDASLVAVFAGGCTYAVHTGHGDVLYSAPWPDIRLDLTRPEVRDLLVRRGAPAWARGIPAALWVWAVTGAAPTMLGPGHGSYRYSSTDHVLSAYRCAPDGCGWEVFVCGTTYEGPDTGDAGREAADRAALAHGCVLTEPGGYIVPTPMGPGWWPKEQG